MDAPARALFAEDLMNFIMNANEQIWVPCSSAELHRHFTKSPFIPEIGKVVQTELMCMEAEIIQEFNKLVSLPMTEGLTMCKLFVDEVCVSVSRFGYDFDGFINFCAWVVGLALMFYKNYFYCIPDHAVAAISNIIVHIDNMITFSRAGSCLQQKENKFRGKHR